MRSNDKAYSVKKIVMTGGPCGGKSESLPILRDLFSRAGYYTIIVPETATSIIKNAIPDLRRIMKEDPVRHAAVQRAILLKILDDEAHYESIARLFEPSCMIMDRGVCDVLAYSPEGVVRTVLAERNMTLQGALSRYDVVVHMVTTAIGAEKFYTKANNTARFEDLAEAKEADLRTRRAWQHHPNFILIDNEESNHLEESSRFANKVHRAYQAILQSFSVA